MIYRDNMLNLRFPFDIYAHVHAWAFRTTFAGIPCVGFINVGIFLSHYEPETAARVFTSDIFRRWKIVSVVGPQPVSPVHR